MPTHTEIYVSSIGLQIPISGLFILANWSGFLGELKTKTLYQVKLTGALGVESLYFVLDGARVYVRMHGGFYFEKYLVFD